MLVLLTMSADKCRRFHSRSRLHCCVFQDLFRKVIPQQCLGSVWSRRASGSSRQNGRPGQSPGCCISDETVASVSATVDQFNAVTHRVIASVVDYTPSSSPASPTASPTAAAAAAATSLSLSQRARVIEKWIDIAQVCTPVYCSVITNNHI